jgi:hypothetical protein
VLQDLCLERGSVDLLAPLSWADPELLTLLQHVTYFQAGVASSTLLLLILWLFQQFMTPCQSMSRMKRKQDIPKFNIFIPPLTKLGGKNIELGMLPLTKLGVYCFSTSLCVCVCVHLCVWSTTEKTAGTISLKFDVRIPMSNTLGYFFHFRDFTYCHISSCATN